jgi:phosphoribosylaminoimidazolecarboxamide formyltransferase / IMP cyclohydrolase
MNPHQRPATASPVTAEAPFRVVHGDPSYINVLDALGAWALVSEAESSLGRTAATSFKHVSPAGAAVAGPLDAVMAQTYGLDAGVGPATSAYVRARDADPKSSYGDFVAVSQPVDRELADLLARQVSDGIIAPGFEPGVVETLAKKKRGKFLVLEADAQFVPPSDEVREVGGVRLTQPRDDVALTRELLRGCGGGAQLPEQELDDLVLGLIVMRHTQSNSVAYLRDGMALGIGAGQQSRIDCTQLAGAKAETWWRRRGCDATSRLTGVAFVSDGALPFVDNVEEAFRHGVTSIAEPGGSIRSGEVRDACDRLGIRLVQTGVRLFRH